MAKKIVAWPLAWLFWWLGDLCSKPMYWAGWLAFMYVPYNKLMGWSIDVQEWAGDLNGPVWPWGPYWAKEDGE